MSKATGGMLHHVELWVPDLPRAVAGWGWLLGELGYTLRTGPTGVAGGSAPLTWSLSSHPLSARTNTTGAAPA